MRTLTSPLVCLLLSVAAPAAAAERLALMPLRSYTLPDDLSLANAQYSGDAQGRTVIAGTGGADLAQRCVILSASDAGAAAYSFRYNNNGTACAGAIAMPDGALLVRAHAPNFLPETAPGVTAAISASGELLWQIEDRALVMARPAGEGGTGAFVGAWSAAHPALAFSPPRARALAFTTAEIRVGQVARPLTQAHSVNPQRGELLVTGQTFGANGLGVLSSLLVSRQEYGDFLLQVAGDQDIGATFYRYDGRQKIEIIRPAMQVWSERQVRPMVAAGEGALALLWRPAAGDAGDWRVTLVQEDGALLWERALGMRAEEEELGEPLAIWGGESMLVIVYLRLEGPVALVLDRQTGETRVEEQALFELTSRTPVTLVSGAEDSLTLLSLDTRTSRMHEDRLALEMVVEGEDMGESDMGGAPDMGPAIEDGGEEEGCGCAAPGSGAVGPLWMMAGWLGLGWARRRRAANGLARRGGLGQDEG